MYSFFHNRIILWRILVSLILENLFVVEQQVSFTCQDVVNCRRYNLVIITSKPLVLVLTNVRGVMACLDGSNVIDDSKQGVRVAPRNVTIFIA